MCLEYKSFENTEGKGEIAREEQFLLFPQRFLLIWKTFFHFHQIRNCVCKLFSVWKSLKFVVRKSVEANSLKKKVDLLFRPIYHTKASFKPVIPKVLSKHNLLPKNSEL